MKVCTIEGCARSTRARGWCATHYSRWRRNGTTERVRRGGPKACAIENCPKPAGVPGTAHGWCSTHYNRWKRTGDPLLTKTAMRPPPPATCNVEGCEKAPWSRGWCPMHLMRWRQTGDPGTADPQWRTAHGPCRVGSCDRDAVVGVHQLCKPHHLRMWRHGDPTAGATSPRPGATCDVTGCAEPHYALRLCGRHWRRAYRPVKSKQRREAPGTASIAQIEARLAYWGWKCWNCRRPYEQIDHVKPIAKGGSNWPANLRPACQSCNARKRSRWFGVVRLNELIREVA